MKNKSVLYLYLLLFAVGLLSVSVAIYLATRPIYTESAYKTDVVIKREIIKEVIENDKSLEKSFFVCSDKIETFKISVDSFKVFSSASIQDSFRVNVTKGIPTKWNGNRLDTPILKIIVLEKLAR